MVTITLYARQQKRHRCIEQSFGLCGRGWGWDGLGQWHWNMYIIICEMDHQSRFYAWYRVLGAGVLGWPRGMGWGGRWERGSGWGTHVHPWWIHVNVWQNQYNNVKLKKKKRKETQRHNFANKGLSSQGYGFSSGHVWMWELDYKESWAPKNWCFWTLVLEKTLESP